MWSSLKNPTPRIGLSVDIDYNNVDDDEEEDDDEIGLVRLISLLN